MKILVLSLPNYTVENEPNSDDIGQLIDDVIRSEFSNKEVVLRGIASSEHPKKTADELVEIIATTGTDKYDPSRTGDRYENITNKHIDLFGVRARVTPGAEISKVIIWGIYHSAKAVHGHPVRIDVIIVYSATKLTQVLHQYEGREDVKDNGFAFNDPNDKVGAVLGIIKLTD